MRILKRAIKWVIKVVACTAFFVFFFDNKVTGTAGTVLLCSIIVMFVFGILWAVLEEYWPDDADSSQT